MCASAATWLLRVQVAATGGYRLPLAPIPVHVPPTPTFFTSDTDTKRAGVDA